MTDLLGQPNSSQDSAGLSDAAPVEAPADAGHYVVYARKWRPQTFEEVVGQEHVSQTLVNALQGANKRIAHAYLFTGPRGVGKTSMARILAKALNCAAVEEPTATPCGQCEQCRSIAAGTNLDVIEIDGASNNRVDEIRELREAVGYTPFAGRYKAYIIDEVHMLSIGAFNALLKTLEEPPPRVVFILATTEQHKIPATIVSRCQPFEFQPISPADIIKRLEYILEQEKVETAAGEKQAILETIAHYAEGGMRDAQVALDQAITLSDGALALSSVQDLLGLVDHAVCAELVAGVRDGKCEELLLLVDRLVAQGRDLLRVVKQTMQFVRDLLIMNNAGAQSRLVQCPADQRQAMERLTAEVTTPFLLNLSLRLVELEGQLKGAAPQRFLVELALIQLASVSQNMELGGLLDEVRSLKTMLAKGPPVPSGAPASGGTPAAGGGRGAVSSGSAMRDSGAMHGNAGGQATAAPMSPPSTVELSDSAGVWDSLIAALDQRRPVLAKQLSGFRVLHLDEKLIELGMPDVGGARAMRDRMLNNNENGQLLTELLKQITGCRLQLKYRIIEAAEQAPTVAQASAEEKGEEKKVEIDGAAGGAEDSLSDAEQRDALNRRSLETYLDPEQRVRSLLADHPDFRQQVRSALDALGGGGIVNVDGVALPDAIQDV